jgi:hypothetical protein
MVRLIYVSCLVIGLTVIGGCDSGAPSVPTPTHTSTSSISNVEASTIGAALSRLASSPEELIAAGSGFTPEQARTAFPPGTAVTPEPSTWRPDGTGLGGVMRVTVTSGGGEPRIYLAVLVKESGAWKVLATLPVTGTASGVTP